MDKPLDLAPLDLPVAPSLWPLPPMAWLTLALFIVVIAAITWAWVRHYQKNRYRHEALQLLKQLSSQPNMVELNRLLRRVALSAFSRPQVANLTGKVWLDWLDSQLASPQFQPMSSWWDSALYQGYQPTEQEWAQASAAAQHWIRNVRSSR
uniref:DUF4381 domain-containing protein n=1 Tax=Thaumasiovibrio occultus TaxID=1891184 RepID=UPI000B35A416|nr:DUF4381 domain-containing protein [Thaumasiovibrio occultus]